MFTYADADCDGRINWSEFQTMINPPTPSGQWATRPTMADLTQKTSLIHPHTLSVTSIMGQSEDNMAKNRSKVAPFEISDTHISASWDQIGLIQS